MYPIRRTHEYLIIISPAMSREVGYTSWKIILMTLRIPKINIPTT